MVPGPRPAGFCKASSAPALNARELPPIDKETPTSWLGSLPGGTDEVHTPPASWWETGNGGGVPDTGSHRTAAEASWRPSSEPDGGRAGHDSPPGNVGVRQDACPPALRAAQGGMVTRFHLHGQESSRVTTCRRLARASRWFGEPSQSPRYPGDDWWRVFTPRGANPRATPSCAWQSAWDRHPALQARVPTFSDGMSLVPTTV